MKAKHLLLITAVLLVIALAGCRAASGAPAPVSPAVPTSTPFPTVTPAPTPTPIASAPFERFDGGRAFAHVEAQMAFGPRPTGSEAAQQTAAYILAELERMGWTAERQPFEYQDVAAQNLIGRAGSEGGPVLLVGAHYDTRRRADRDPATPEQPVPGANDGASGVAVLLELARVLNLTAVDGEVWLVFFDAEDNGGLDGWDWIAGSTYFAGNMSVTPEYLILVDMIGDADQNLYYERNSDVVLMQHLWEIAANMGYGEYFIPTVNHSILDDHIPFLQQGIPAVDIIDFDYPYWHTTQDTVDKVSPDSLERVGRVIEAFLETGGAYPGP
ncbi:MAG: M28 family peptidase [Anaerolineae bacterium]